MKNKILPHDHGDTIHNVLKRMPETERFLEAAPVFQQLGDGSRLRILWLLCHCEECVSNIAVAVDMSDSAVSHHLKTLRLHGLINGRREGKEVYYTLADNEKARFVHKAIEEFFDIGCPSDEH
jgi:Predicted transcriptional regulators